MASSISFSYTNLIDTMPEKGGELLVRIFCVVAPIASYEDPINPRQQHKTRRYFHLVGIKALN